MFPFLLYIYVCPFLLLLVALPPPDVSCLPLMYPCLLLMNSCLLIMCPRPLHMCPRPLFMRPYPLLLCPRLLQMCLHLVLMCLCSCPIRPCLLLLCPCLLSTSPLSLEEVNDTHLVCQTASSNQTGGVVVRVLFGKAARAIGSMKFRYLDDPVVTEASPAESFYA